MTCPSYPNPISIQDVINEFGRNQQTTSLSEFYANGSKVRPGTIGYPIGNATQIPGGGAISLGNFHGATNIQLLEFYGSTVWTVPSGVFNPLVLIVGGGGGGGGHMDGNYAYGCGGGGGGGIWLGRIGVSPGQQVGITVGGGGAGARGTPNGRGGNGGNSAFGGMVVPGGGGGGGALLTTVMEYREGYFTQGSGKEGQVWVSDPGYFPVTRIVGSGADGGGGGGACQLDTSAVPGNGNMSQRGGFMAIAGGTRWNGGGGGYSQPGGNGGFGGSYGGAGVDINMVIKNFSGGGGGGAGNTFAINTNIPASHGGGFGGGVISNANNGANGTGGGGGGGGNFLGGNGGSGTVWVLMP